VISSAPDSPSGSLAYRLIGPTTGLNQALDAAEILLTSPILDLSTGAALASQGVKNSFLPSDVVLTDPVLYVPPHRFCCPVPESLRALFTDAEGDAFLAGIDAYLGSNPVPLLPSPTHPGQTHPHPQSFHSSIPGQGPRLQRATLVYQSVSLSSPGPHQLGQAQGLALATRLYRQPEVFRKAQRLYRDVGLSTSSGSETSPWDPYGAVALAAVREMYLNDTEEAEEAQQDAKAEETEGAGGTECAEGTGGADVADVANTATNADAADADAAEVASDAGGSAEADGIEKKEEKEDKEEKERKERKERKENAVRINKAAREFLESAARRLGVGSPAVVPRAPPAHSLPMSGFARSAEQEITEYTRLDAPALFGLFYSSADTRSQALFASALERQGWELQGESQTFRRRFQDGWVCYDPESHCYRAILPPTPERGTPGDSSGADDTGEVS